VQEKFSQSFLARECRNSKESGAPEATQISAVRDVLRTWYGTVVQAFTYYSVSVSSVPFFMGLNEWSALMEICGVPDNDSPGAKRSDLDTIFIVCVRKARTPRPASALPGRRGAGAAE
jgi:hypothetical protein